MTGYRFVLNQDRDRRDDWAEKLLSLYRDIDGFLLERSSEGPYLFDELVIDERCMDTASR